MFFIDKRKVISKVFIFALFPTEVEEWRSPERNPEAKDDERRAATPTKPPTPRGRTRAMRTLSGISSVARRDRSRDRSRVDSRRRTTRPVAKDPPDR